MQLVATRLLVLVLVFQQLGSALPAHAAVNMQAGKPLDSPALAGANAVLQAQTVEASLFTGDATHRLPILVPPGTGGLTPELALAYSSAASREAGPLGVGWSLDVGPAVIERSTREGAPAYDASDGFELAGSRLRQTASAGRYVVENHDASRIEHVTSGGDYWRVLRPDGTRLYFGYHHAPGASPKQESRLDSLQVKAHEPTPAVCPDPFQSCAGRETIVPPGIPFAWYLDRVEDRNGNVVRLRWESLGDPGLRYLVELAYSEHVGGSADALPDFGGPDDGTLATARVVRFTYDLSRVDRLPSYRSGFRSQVRNRLGEIHVEVDGAGVRHYRLGYEQSPASGRSRLTSVRERDASDSAATELVYAFGYGDGGTPGWSAKNPAWALPAGLSFVAGGQDQGIRLLDVNGDGYVDVVQARSGMRHTYLGSPAGFNATPAPQWTFPVNLLTGDGFTGAVTGDLDGDGRPDILRRRLDASGTNVTAGPCGTSRQHEVGTLARLTLLNTGSGFASSPADDPAPQPFTTWAQARTGSALSCPAESLHTASRLDGLGAGFDQATRLLDVNGDGLDDLIWKRAVSGSHVEDSSLWLTDELRSGTLLSQASGLASGTLNNAHEGATLQQTPSGIATDVEFRKHYALPRWQPPLDSPLGVFWSNFNTCRSSQNRWAQAHTGKERVVDLNGDGLPEILESLLFYTCVDVEPLSGTCNQYQQYNLLGSFVNNGYGWQLPSALHPEAGILPPYLFYGVVEGYTQTWFDYPLPGQTTCVETDPGDAADYGVRIVDVNGDGGPDVIGGGLGLTNTLLWDATVPIIGLQTSLWQHDPAWSTPVVFDAQDAEDMSARLADVNADGMLDIVESNGAYLNRAEPPDHLESVSTPWGATTTLEYAPHTAFEIAPAANPTSPDGQRRFDGVRWVVSRIEVDAGAAFDQPPVAEELAYFGPVQDLEDRAFRGFAEVAAIGPVTGDRRVVRRTSFHVSDALRGLPRRVRVSSAPANDPDAGILLHELGFDYAAASGADAEATLYRADGSTAGLAAVDPLTQSAAFDAFTALLASSPEAGSAWLALPIARSVAVYEGQPSALVSREEQSVDVHGNVLEERALGDVADPSDDVTTAISYATVDGILAGEQVLLSRPTAALRSGVQGSLPSGTLLQRELRLFYDGSSTPAALVRGNPTAVDRRWKGGTTWVRTEQAFDAYGNATQLSFPFDLAAPGAVSRATSVYDAESRTFATAHAVGNAAAPELALGLTLDYALLDCGAPPGLGRVCRITDPNGQSTSFRYDGFGRQIHASGPNGAEAVVAYHDAERGTAGQRIETRLRWDPDEPGGSALASDPDAIVEETFFDGLGRTLAEIRRGRGSDVANATLGYDAAGRVAQQTRWSSAGPGPATSLAYDVLGRLTRQTRPDGSFLAFAHAPRQVAAETYSAGTGLAQRRVEHLDGQGRLAAVDEYPDVEGTPTTTRYRYDPFEALVEVADAVTSDPGLCSGAPACPGQRHATRLFYDELGNRVRLEEPDSGTWTWEFDARGLPIRSEDPRGLRHALTFDALGRLARRHALNPLNPADPSEADHVYSYGLVGTAGPHELGRLLRIDDGEGHDAFAYDAAGNVAFHRRTIAGRRFDFTHRFDPLGRLRETEHPDGETITWHYDKRQLARISTAGGAYAGDYVADAAYDALDRLRQAKLGGSAGAPVLTQSWSHDPSSGRLERIQAAAGGSTLAQLDYAIDGSGRIRTLELQARPLGAGALEARSFAFDYDGLDRLIRATGNLSPDPLAVDDLSYAYDALGNLRQKDDQVGGTGAGWASLDYADSERPHALTAALAESGAQSLALSYDAAGNVIAKTRTQAAGSSVTSLVYDSLGRATRIASPASATWQLGWSADGRRLRSEQSDAQLLYPEPGYEYHVRLGRVNKHVFLAGIRVASSARSWTAPAADAPDLFNWRGPQLPALPPGVAAGAWALCALALLAVALRRRPAATYAPALRAVAAVLLALVTPALLAASCRGGPHPLGTHGEAALFYATDHLNSTLAAVDPSGAIRHRYLYRPFGDPLLSHGASLHHRFTGEELLESAGLYALGPRQYDPQLGRFLQPDPLVADPADPQAFNRYAYVRNDPLRLVDPSGLRPQEGGTNGADLIVLGAGIGALLHAVLGGHDAPQPPKTVPAGPPIPSSASHIPTASGRDPAERGSHWTQPRTPERAGEGIEGSEGENPKDQCAEGRCGAHGIGLIDIPFILLGYGISKYLVGAISSRIAGSIRNVNPTSSMTNCVNCVIATESTLAGAPASALPGGPTTIGVLQQTYGGKFGRFASREAIERALTGAGPGARGIVLGARAAAPGHVFNAVNQGGTVRFLDGQIGGPANFAGDFVELYFMPINF